MKTSIVIPAYKPTSLLQSCLQGIVNNTELTDIEVIVVCNGSDRDSAVAVINLGYPFRLVWYDEPLGFTKAVNTGIKLAQGEVIVLMNTDAVILPYCEKNVWLDRLTSPLSNPKTGVAGLGTMWTEYGSFVPFYCTAIKKQMFDELGLLDERFNPGYCEDADFCFRVREAGYEIVSVDQFIPDIDDPTRTVTDFPIWHAGEQSFQDKEKRQENVTKGVTLLREKWSKHV